MISHIVYERNPSPGIYRTLQIVEEFVPLPDFWTINMFEWTVPKHNCTLKLTAILPLKMDGWGLMKSFLFQALNAYVLQGRFMAVAGSGMKKLPTRKRTQTPSGQGVVATEWRGRKLAEGDWHLQEKDVQCWSYEYPMILPYSEYMYGVYIHIPDIYIYTSTSN